MRVILTGAGGQLARCLQDRCPASWQLIALDRQALDITDEQAVTRLVARGQPEWIINAAAYTAVDAAESDIPQALAINQQGPANLARAAREAGARFIHLSTDYVFDGRTSRPYTEHDTPAPLNAYGRSKLLGEQDVLRILPQALVVRTSGVYSEYGKNFVKTMLRLASSPSLRVVADQYTNPTYAGDLADALISLMAWAAPPAGIYHYCGATTLSWHAFAQQIFDCARQQDRGLHIPLVQPISADAYAAAAQRPAHAVLSCEKIKGLGVSTRLLKESLPAVVQAILAELTS